MGVEGHGVADAASLATSTSVLTNSSWIERCSSRREPAMQVWPVAAKMPEMAPMTAVDIGILEDDVGRLAAQFERDVLEVLGGDS